MKVTVWNVVTHNRLDGLTCKTFASSEAAVTGHREAVTESPPGMTEIEIHEGSVEVNIDLVLEAALCAWEWMLDHRKKAPLVELWNGLGSSAMRSCSMQAGAIALATYELMESKGIEFHDSYDWEFVPDVLVRLDWKKLTEHNQYNGPAYEPDLEGLLLQMMKSNSSYETPLQRWTDEVRKEADKQWGYADLVGDHEDKIEIGETPALWVKRIGEKYDLTPKGNW